MTETFPMEKIKIAQIGVCHEHASGKITALRRLPELFEIVGVVDGNATSTPPKLPPSFHSFAPPAFSPSLSQPNSRLPRSPISPVSNPIATPPPASPSTSRHNPEHNPKHNPEA